MRILTCSLMLVGIPWFAAGCSTRQHSTSTPNHLSHGVCQIKGLRWLQRHQNWDGSWGSDSNKTWNTGLAVFAFLNHGETPDSKEFGRAVTRGLDYLVKSVGQDGRVRDKSLRAQGVVTLALAEAYGMIGAPHLQKPLTQALRASSRALEELGPVNRMTDDDLMAMVWLVSSLRSARLSGVEVPKEFLVRLREKLWAAYGQNGEFAAPDGQGSPARTTASVSCLQLLGRTSDPRLEKSLDYLMQRTKAEANNRDWLTPETRCFLSQLMFRAGGKYWVHHHKGLLEEMLAAQAPDGHWEAPPVRAPAGCIPLSDLTATIFSLVSFPPPRYLPLYGELEHR